MKSSTGELSSADRMAAPVVVAVGAAEFQFTVLEKLGRTEARMDMIFIRESKP
jgi:hypothetical protein